MEKEQEKSPDSVTAEIRASEGIESLSTRTERYSNAKKTALDIADYMLGAIEGEDTRIRRIADCGNYLAFRHYFTIDKVRLHAASFCMQHLLCPLCAIRRGSKALSAYVTRWDAIKSENPLLKPYLVTLTVKDGADLMERFLHLKKSQRELWKRKQRGRGCSIDSIRGAVWSYEFKRGQNSGLWHPHLHMVALCETPPDQDNLSNEWKSITRDSHVVDVRPISEDDPVSGFIEVFKYAVKFSDQPPEDTVHCWRIAKGKRLLESSGCFRGVEVPDDLTDEPLDDLPFIEYFYRYLNKDNRYFLSQR